MKGPDKNISSEKQHLSQHHTRAHLDLWAQSFGTESKFRSDSVSTRTIEAKAVSSKHGMKHELESILRYSQEMRNIGQVYINRMASATWSRETKLEVYPYLLKSVNATINLIEYYATSMQQTRWGWTHGNVTFMPGPTIEQ